MRVLTQVAEIAEAAFECWWQDQHPGWMIFTLGNNHFESLDQIIKVHVHSIILMAPALTHLGRPPCSCADCLSTSPKCSADEGIVGEGYLLS